MLSVQTNLLAMNADRQLKANTKKNAKTTEKLSSGYKINRAADDAAGLSMSEKMRRQIRGLHQSANNISEGIGYVQTAEGALNEVQDMLHRVNELAVKAANGTNTEQDRQYIDSEIQQLKKEMDRIFETTTFNEQRIWEPKAKVQIGSVTREAVTMPNTGSPPTITNSNYDVFPGGNPYSLTSGSYQGFFGISADDSGVKVNWTGYNGKKYETEKIPWKDFEENNYSFEMSKYFDKAAFPDLFGADGKPVFEHRVSFRPSETATKEDIIECIDGSRIGAIAYAGMSGSWENVQGNNTNMAIGNVVLNYPAAYASMMGTGNVGDGYNFDGKDDAFLEPDIVQNKNLAKYPPTAANAEEAKKSNTGWQFDFTMKGIGDVKASSTSITYFSNDFAPEDEGLWWHYETYFDIHGKPYKVQVANGKPADGTLAGAMSALTGDEKDGTPGLLNRDLSGCNDGTTGTIRINFKLESDTPFNYTDANGNSVSSKSVGSFTLSFSFSSSETEDQVLDRIQKALNENSILDFESHSASTDSISFASYIGKVKYLDEPVWGGICEFYVQGGTESGEHIEVQYESLSTIAMGLKDTNVLTIDDAGDAIHEVKKGLQIISEQRSAFGAYQNRLEHSENINRNVEENTQASESVLRDADIAEEIMEFSVNNILMQAGTSMLTQANQSKQSVLSLLN